MSDPDQRQFKLIGPDGHVIAHGSMSACMEHLPDTVARNKALDSMLKTATEAVEAEERRDAAVASTVRMLADGAIHLASRLDAYITRREAQRKADEEEAEREEQERIRSMLDALPDPDDPSQYPDPSLTPDPREDEGLSYSGAPMANAQEPPAVGTDPVYDPAELAHPQKQPSQPVSVSFHED